jgi:hypothetical protein
MKKLAIAVIHGIGQQKKSEPLATGVPTFSDDLRKCLRVSIGKHRFDSEIAWREIFWSDILQDRQDIYIRNMEKFTKFSGTRGFVMYNLADAASYFPSDYDVSVYHRVHRRVHSAIADLEADVEQDAPLLLLAHSLGGHILSNVIYDIEKGKSKPMTPFQRMETFAGLITFGCNIPVFIFGTDEPKPIRFPGKQGRPLMPWWRNFYDQDDPLGYPLEPIGKGYAELVRNGELMDRQIDVGLPVMSSTPFSHNAYWTDPDFWLEVAKAIRVVMESKAHWQPAPYPVAAEGTGVQA